MPFCLRRACEDVKETEINGRNFILSEFRYEQWGENKKFFCWVLKNIFREGCEKEVGTLNVYEIFDKLNWIKFFYLFEGVCLFFLLL